MNRAYFTIACTVAAGCLGSEVQASPIGQLIASRVDAANYRHYLDDLLYTHNGANKGIAGAQHDPCRNNIAATLQSLGLSVELHPFTYLGNTYYNVIATKTGAQYPNIQYVLGAHYDSVNNPGADDDASGVAAMMEIARAISQFETRYTIKFCAWDREEQGKIGSTAYVNAHIGDDIRGMVQLDMIAHDVGSNREDMWGNAASAPLRTNLLAAAAAYGNGINFVYAGNASFSDHAPFANAGYQAVCFVEYNYQQFGCYHQPCDSVDTANYIHYTFASNLARAVAGYLADAAVAFKRGDVNGDGYANIDDLFGVISAWGQCPAPPSGCPADVAPVPGNGYVNIDDLFAVINNWG
jgi:hypothetical protein